MAIRIRNRSRGAVRVRDYYNDPVSQTGYYGARNYVISGGGGSKSISSSVFTKEITQNLMYPQEIRVLREDVVDQGEAPPPLILFHYQFDDNDGRDLLLETDANNRLTYRFADPPKDQGGGSRLLQKIWYSLQPLTLK